MSTKEDTARSILDAAMKLFAEHGYAGTTTRAIADEAGVNEVTLFRHFGSKAGILRSLGERIAERAAASAVAASPDPEDVRATLLHLARHEIASAVWTGGFAIRLAFDARTIPEVGELLAEGPSSNLEGLAEYLAERQAAGGLRDDIDPRVMAEAFFGLTSSYVMYRMVMGAADLPHDIETDEGIEQLFDIFWSGAAAKEART
jgi:AcrR family transcriptional regulator